jgi:hypothetical protein
MLVWELPHLLYEKVGYPLQKLFDFQVKGVPSLSADTYNYGSLIPKDL